MNLSDPIAENLTINQDSESVNMVPGDVPNSKVINIVKDRPKKRDHSRIPKDYQSIEVLLYFARAKRAAEAPQTPCAERLFSAHILPTL